MSTTNNELLQTGTLFEGVVIRLTTRQCGINMPVLDTNDHHLPRSTY